MFLLSKQKDTALLLEADNKAELIQQLRLHPEAVVILDYTLFDFTGADCQGWMREAGFRETRVVHLVGPDSMVIGIK